LTDRDSPSGRALRKAGADVIELRLDNFSSFSPAHLRKQIQRVKPLPVLATVRSKAEGGKWKGTEASRLELFRQVLPAVDGVDIELSAVQIRPALVQAARRLKKTVVVSYHNFKKTPSSAELKKIVRAAAAAGADIVKIATWVRSTRDLHVLGSLLMEGGPKPLAVIGMGEKGRATRLLFPSLGSRLTYVHTGRAMAPGQFDLATMHHWLKRLKN